MLNNKAKSATSLSKLGSILMIIFLIGSGLFVIIPNNLNIYLVTEASSWEQTSDTDFYNGTLNNVSLNGAGDAAELKINLSDIQQWVKKNPSSKPSARMYVSMATVWNTDKIVLFGGLTANDETWIYDLKNNTWTDKTPSPRPANYPTNRYGHAMAAIPGTDQVLLFGGWGSGFLNDTWVYDLSTDSWADKTPLNPNPTNNPSTRYFTAAATVHGTNKVVLFGGRITTIPWYVDDTWEFDGVSQTWSLINIVGSKPSGRNGHTMAPVYDDDKAVLFGGLGSSGYKDDTWVYDSSTATWTQKSPNPKPTGRYLHAMASIHGTDKMILFGGWWNNDDTWVYDFKNDIWKDRTPSPRPTSYPTGRYSHAMAGVYGTDNVVLFGGRDSSGNDDETWTHKYFLKTKNGTYVSGAYDTFSNSSFKTLSWSAITPDHTNLSIQLRTASSMSELSLEDFVGPDGSPSSYYTSSPSDIWSGHTGDRWVQYTANLNISIYTDSPKLRDVTISYNCLPNTIIIGPVNGSLLSTNKPTFVWTFNDYDSTQQKAFQVQISGDSKFENITYDTGEQTAITERWEFPTGTSYTEMHDGAWYWRVRTKDIDAIWTEYNMPWMIVIDTQAPGSAPITPINDRFYSSLNTISGIGIDPSPGSGIILIEITIKRFDNQYWNGSGWAPFIAWLPTTGTMDWVYDPSIVSWTSNTEYLIQSRATDKAGNVEEPGIGSVFTIDIERPESYITLPANNTWLSNLKTISGISLDGSGSGVGDVEINIMCCSDYSMWDSGPKENDYWDGTKWTSEEIWLPTNGKTEWTYNASNIPLTTGDHFIIHSRAIDEINNVEVPTLGTTFKYDSEPPENLIISINDEAEYTGIPTVNLTLAGEDIGSGIAKMCFSTDGSIWSNWKPYNTSPTFELSTGDGEKYIYFKVQDFTGNVAEPVFDTIIFDTTPPEQLSILINENSKYTNTKNIDLSLTAFDKHSGPHKMTFSSDGAHWYPWFDFELEKSLTFTTADGEKTVYFKVMDKVGNIAEPVHDTIILDTTPPSLLSVVINNGLIETNSTTVKLYLSAFDELSGLDNMSFRPDGDNWSSWEDFMSTRTYELTQGNSEKIVYFKVKDSAGNIADAVSSTIVLNITAPSNDVKGDIADTRANTFATMSWLILGIIAIIVLVLAIIGMLIRKNRKRQALYEALPAGTLTVKPGTVSAPVISYGKVPSTLKVPPLSGPRLGVGAFGTGAAGAAAIPKIPMLAKITQSPVQQPTINTQPGSAAVPQNLPALPPARKIVPEVKTSPTPTIATPATSTSISTPAKPQAQPPAQPQASQKTPMVSKPNLPGSAPYTTPKISQSTQGPKVHLPE